LGYIARLEREGGREGERERERERERSFCTVKKCDLLLYCNEMV
jgi:hypothetical protein